MKYIDTEKLKAEINKRYQEYRTKSRGNKYYEGMADSLDYFEQFIDSLLQEQSISSNFDEAVARYLESQTPADQGEEMTIYNAFKEGANWAIKQLKEK